MQNQRHLMVGSLLMALAFGACGDDEKKSDTTPDGDSGNDGSGGDGSGGDGASQEPQPIECGSNTCTAPELGGQLGGLIAGLGGGGEGGGATDALNPTACCAGEAKDLCGVQSTLLSGETCFEQNQVGKPAAVCTGLDLSVLGPISLKLQGCCKPSNECGIQLGDLGVGCMERTEVSEVAMMGLLSQLGGFGIDAGPVEPLQAIGCDYAAAGSDAGTDGDAGADPADGDAGTPAGDAGVDAGQ